VVSVGSCGAKAGLALLNQMTSLVSRESAQFLVLKALSKAEGSWESPFAWDHPCLQTSHLSLLQKHPDSQVGWAFDCAVIAWVVFFFATLVIALLIGERQRRDSDPNGSKGHSSCPIGFRVTINHHFAKIPPFVVLKSPSLSLKILKEPWCSH